MEVYLDMWDYEPIGRNTTDLKVSVYNGRLEIYMTDHTDVVQGYFRSVEDIELVIKELQEYVNEVKK